eukprot:CAMPEP_0198282828 /NCGR_PEP_ID=MMETSP1449-20131203/2581_1 /TAXON_ID=420275 /ORGANISM="Attheya septentrionalis, Strain CCMP2084" /LENGTH=475 /DNA_ID=CAMNT_0043979243 /DNA_START=75 /DNA_END=1502 /DNA_ORIENTATION=-
MIRLSICCVLLVLSLSPLLVFGQPCYSSLAAIYNTEAGRGINPSFQRIYTLCPRTTFRIGTWNEDGVLTDGIDYPLIFFRPNIRVQCGLDGSIANNCVFSGGDYQVEMEKASLLEEKNVPDTMISNIEVVGVTFTGSKIHSVYADSDSPGSISFIDCHWTGNFGFGPVWSGEGENESVSLPNVLTKFDSCKFTDNKIDLTLALEDLNSYVKYWGGVITSENQQLEVTNSLFRNNQFGADIGALEFTYIIYVYEGINTVRDNCFVDNLSSFGTMVQENGTNSIINNYGRNNRMVTGEECTDNFRFAAGSMDDPINAQVSCTPFDGVGCKLIPSAAPTKSPTLAPINIPVPVSPPSALMPPTSTLVPINIPVPVAPINMPVPISPPSALMPPVIRIQPTSAPVLNNFPLIPSFPSQASSEEVTAKKIPTSDKVLTFPPFELSNFGSTRKEPISKAPERFSRNIFLSVLAASAIFLVN